jgi:hypothetical protein
VRCIYGNVCKTLDENFKRVDCTLWPKKLGQAPSSDDAVPPEWPALGAALVGEYKDGRVLLRWRAATDNEAMYGYEVFRGDDDLLLHHASVRALSARYEDTRVRPGVTYKYGVKPYDLAGNRGVMSASVSVRIPD